MQIRRREPVTAADTHSFFELLNLLVGEAFHRVGIGRRQVREQNSEAVVSDVSYFDYANRLAPVRVFPFTQVVSVK